MLSSIGNICGLLIIAIKLSIGKGSTRSIVRGNSSVFNPPKTSLESIMTSACPGAIA